MSNFSHRDNWYALIVSILGNCIPEMAFKKLESDNPDRVVMRYTKEDLEDMHKIKSSGVTYASLAEIYCSTPDSLYHTLNRNERKAREHEKRLGIIWAGGQVHGKRR